MKKFAGNIIILHVYQKSQSYDVPEIQSETNRSFCHFGPSFALLPPPTPTPNVTAKWVIESSVNTD